MDIVQVEKPLKVNRVHITEFRCRIRGHTIEYGRVTKDVPDLVIEPENANGLNQSLRANQPLNYVNVNSIADSLSAPLHMQYSFDVAKEVIDEMVTVSDEQMKEFMVFCYKKFKLFLEPACVAGLAALKYKISNELIGKNTMVILCGSNIDKKTWLNLTN